MCFIRHIILSQTGIVKGVWGRSFAESGNVLNFPRKRLAIWGEKGIISVTNFLRWTMNTVFSVTASYYASFGWTRFMSTGYFAMSN
jgi:hypothetical protein